MAASLRLLVVSGSFFAAAAVRSSSKGGQLQAEEETAQKRCCCKPMGENDTCYSGWMSGKHLVTAAGGSPYCCKGRGNECKDDDKYPHTIRSILRGGRLANPYTCEIYADKPGSTCCCMETGGSTGKTCLKGNSEDGKKIVLNMPSGEFCCKVRTSGGNRGCDAEEARYNKPLVDFFANGDETHDVQSCAMLAPEDDVEEEDAGSELEDEVEEDNDMGVEEWDEDDEGDDDGPKLSSDELESFEAEDDIDQILDTPSVTNTMSEDKAARVIQKVWKAHIKNQAGELGEEQTLPSEEHVDAGKDTALPQGLDVTKLFLVDGKWQKSRKVADLELLCCCWGQEDVTPGVRCELENKAHIDGPSDFSMKRSCGRKGASWHSLVTIQGLGKYAGEDWTDKCVVTETSLNKFALSAQAAIQELAK
eukprot:TRINITY_DN90414_c0_g1_i1.p1 TRINITY_DN90414_c0_g1~~TRINITY_DN90414_c0_g1_i1.p1  ORF type:complete len:420 (-),score=137.66 TRINITY_DN90414_c0_g1_i1:178-1437(-)